MSVLRLAGQCILISMAFNMVGNEGIKLERIGTGIYWLWTVALALVICVAVIVVHIRQGILVAEWLNRYPHRELIQDNRLYTAQLPLKERIWAIMTTAMLIQLPYSFFIFLIAFVRPHDTLTLFGSYMLYYMPWLSTICFAYVSYIFTRGRLWWLRPEMMTVIGGRNTADMGLSRILFVPVETVVEKEVKIVPPHVLDERIVIGSLFDILYHHGGFETSFSDKKAVRMFDVPFYFSSKNGKEVILVDGTRRKADRYMQELEKLGLHKWYFRINSTCYVNMMHIRYPVKPNAATLEFHREVFNGLRKELKAAEILKLLLITEWMRKEKKLAKFLDNIAELRHKGWDDFIPLN